MTEKHILPLLSLTSFSLRTYGDQTIPLVNETEVQQHRLLSNHDKASIVRRYVGRTHVLWDYIQCTALKSTLPFRQLKKVNCSH